MIKLVGMGYTPAASPWPVTSGVNPLKEKNVNGFWAANLIRTFEPASLPGNRSWNVYPRVMFWILKNEPSSTRKELSGVRFQEVTIPLAEG